jgi:hypothetical protein
MIEEKIIINSIQPARFWDYLYVESTKGIILIYAHRDRVKFFVFHEAENLSRFKDHIAKLFAIKFFNEKSEKCHDKIGKIDLVNITDDIIKIGTCLVIAGDHGANFKAELWINNKDKKIELFLKDAGEYENKKDPNINLSDFE